MYHSTFCDVFLALPFKKKGLSSKWRFSNWQRSPSDLSIGLSFAAMMAAVGICLKPAQRQLTPIMLLTVNWGCKPICQSPGHKYKTSPASDMCIHEETTS